MKLRSLYKFELKPKESFNFHLTASCYNFNWWFDGTRCIVPLSSSPPLMAITRYKSGRLVTEVYGLENVDVDITRRVEHAFGTQEDLNEFYEVVRRDLILREVPTLLQGMRMRATNLWNALLIAVCQQNTSFLQGWRMLCRIYKLMGIKVEIDGVTTIIPPGPESFLSDGCSKDLLKKAGVGYRAETLIRVSMAIKRGLLDEVEYLNDSEAESILKEIKGIGSYSARLALILSQRRYGLLPLDRWLKRLAEEVYEFRDVEEDLRAMWGKWCGLAAFFTTVVLDAEELRNALKRALSGDVKPKLKRGVLSPLTLWMHSIC